MAKPTKTEALADWRRAEQRYADTIAPFMAEDGEQRIDKDAAVRIAKARAKADKRLDAVLHRLLD